MASAVLPGADFAVRELVLKTVSAGATWRRLFETRFPDPLGHAPGLSRFSDPTGRAFNLVYLGSSFRVAFVETILRDHADGRGADCIIDRAEIEKSSMAVIQPIADLRLVDLTGNGGLRMGVPSDVVGARDQTLARTWSAAFHAHPDQPDGVFYPSRLNEERCAAVYHRAVGKLRVIARPMLMDCRSELAATLEGLELAVI